MPLSSSLLPIFYEAFSPKEKEGLDTNSADKVCSKLTCGNGEKGGSDPEFPVFRDEDEDTLHRAVDDQAIREPAEEPKNTIENPLQHSMPNSSSAKKEIVPSSSVLIIPLPLSSSPKMVSSTPIVSRPLLDPPCLVIKSTRSFKTKLFQELDMALELLGAILYGSWGILVGIVMTFIPRRFRYKDVTGQVVLITGAGSGIGRLMAKKFAIKHGAIVVAWDINQKGNEETVKWIQVAGGNCYGYTVDVSSREDIYKAAEKVKKDVGKVDILINNAGIVFGKRLLETPDENIVKTFEVNAMSNFWTTKAFLPAMLETGQGHIVTIASLAGLFGTNRLVDYCASKFAAVGFDEALKNEIKVELGYDEIHATLVCPYYINTGMFEGVRSKIIPLLSPEPVVNDIVAGILTNQEQIVIPRYVYMLIVLRLLVPGEVGRRIATAFGITGAMLSFKGSAARKSVAAMTTTSSNPPLSSSTVTTQKSG